MSASSLKASPQQPCRTTLGNGIGRGGDNDLTSFNLRDTLGGIVVREANFGEFLAALKSFAPQTAKQ